MSTRIATKSRGSSSVPVTRRDALRQARLSACAATLAGVLRGRAAQGAENAGNGIAGPANAGLKNDGTARPTSVIFVTMGGGASQFETFDPKPDAPLEYRGAFAPISTKLPGVAFCELLPQLATLADRLAVVRSVHHQQASHIAEHIVETGFDLVNPSNSRAGEMPSMGAAVSRIRGTGESSIPAYVSLPRHHAYAGAHWLGAQHHHFAVDDDPNLDTFTVGNIALLNGMTVDRMRERRTLRSALVEQSKRHRADDASGLDQFSQQAFDLITGDRARKAFDIRAEDPRLRDRYGRNSLGQRMLLARRLVEAGVPFVTVRMFDWDDHEDLAPKIRARAPLFDTGLAALIQDLADRGLGRDVLVFAMGEFGRTPRVNAMRGRDHYPAVNSVLFAGGGYRMGQVIGATDRMGASVAAAPYGPQSVLSMLYRHLGIDPATTFPDYAGRPRALLEDRRPVVELT